MLWIKICQCLKDLCNSGNAYFLNDQCMILQSCSWVKEPFKVEDRPHVTEYEKLIDVVSDSTLQLTLISYYLWSFGVGSRNICSYLKIYY